MRILEVTSNDFVILYRGDAQQVDRYDIKRTDSLALFGQGIYLTDSKRVARDYTAKGGEVLMRYNGGNKKAEAIAAYIRQMARYTFNPDGSRKSILDPSTDLAYMSVANHPKAEPARQAMQHAEAEWERIKKDVDVRVQLDGLIVIRRKEKKPPISAFRIPRRIIDKMLDAEAVIEQDVLDVLLSALRRHGDHRTADDIDRQVNDRFREEDFTFRQVWTGLTADAPTSTAEVQQEMRLELLRMGCPGIVYQGGITMGGGHRHRAYVFFDSRTINKYRYTEVA